MIMKISHSVLSKASYQKWNLDASPKENTEVVDLLETLTSEHEKQIDLRCEGCQMTNDYCNCSIDEIASENAFQVFVIMESRKNFGTHFCPQLSVKSDFLYCDEAKTERISAKMICDGAHSWKKCEAGNPDFLFGDKF